MELWNSIQLYDLALLLQLGGPKSRKTCYINTNPLTNSEKNAKICLNQRWIFVDKKNATSPSEGRRGLSEGALPRLFVFFLNIGFYVHHRAIYKDSKMP